MLLGLGAALIAAVLYGVSSVLQAAGARRVQTGAGLDPRVAVDLLRQPTFLAALAMVLFGFVFHLLAVRLVPLFLAQAGIAVSLVVTALLAVRMFDDRLDGLEWSVVAAVVVGLVLLSAAAGDVGPDRDHPALVRAMAAVLVLMVVLGWVAARSRGVVASAGLGLLGGLGYAVVGVSSRLLPDLRPADLVASPVTYLLGLGGTLALFLYSLALQRGSAVAATTPLIVIQTVVPAVVGVLVLGDQVRPGWWPAAGLGFAITAAAAVVLVRFEGVRVEEVDDERQSGPVIPPAG